MLVGPTQLTFFAEEQPEYRVSEVRPERGKSMVIYTKESLIDELRKIRNMGWIHNARPGNSGGVGNTLEDLLGIHENNLPIPNAAEWELKCQRATTTSHVTLFHMEPSPRAMRFVPQVFLPRYGWPSEGAGLDYPVSELSFRQTISALGPSDRGFRIVVSRAQSRVLVSFDPAYVDQRHEAWLRTVEQRVGLGKIDPQPYWGFDDLRNKAGTKLLNCFYVRAEVMKQGGEEFFRYSTIAVLKGFDLERLLCGLEEGYVYVDFDARTGHNHGTKFRLRQGKLPALYTEILEV